MKRLLLFCCVFFVGIEADNRTSEDLPKCINSYQKVIQELEKDLHFVQRYKPEVVCNQCLALKNKQKDRCINCITNKKVILKANEPWCHFYATSGSKSLLKELQTSPYLKN